MLNPYVNVDWSNDNQIVTTTHDHVLTHEGNDPVDPTATSAHFQSLYNGGIRCFAISNYYPSAPMYPLSEYTEYIGGSVPNDIIEIPNAEHHNLAFNGRTGNSIHMNSLGSTFSIGNYRGISPSGYAGGRIEDLIKDITDNLLYSDGGGITVNHPTWTYNQNLFSMDILKQILDMDDRILGIEIYSGLTWDVDLWDEILISGRRCWGFAVPDHKHKTMVNWYGRNVLVVPELTQYECLKAFRNGNMYCKYANTDLKFTEISFANNTLTVKTNAAATIRFIMDGVKVSETENVTTASHDASDAMIYIRAEAETATDRILSQPIMFSIQKRRKVPIKRWKYV